MKSPFLVLLGVALCVGAASAQTTVRCQDKDGRTVYVDRDCAVYGLRSVGRVQDRLNVETPGPAGADQGDTRVPDERTVGPKPAAASAPLPRADDPAEIRKRAIALCQKSRGSDCESDDGLRQWIVLETPLTQEQQQAAVAARRFRELCEKTQYTAQNCDILQMCDQGQYSSEDCTRMLQ